MASTIFVIDSSPAVRRMVEEVSAPEGFEVVGFQDGPAALEAARRMSPHLIIADYHLDNITFSGFCKEVHKLDNLSETYIVTLVSPSDRLDETKMRSWGVKASLTKPFQADSLIDVIKDLEEQHASRTNGQKKKSRSWPPVSNATDSEDDITLDDDQTEEEAQAIISPANPKPKDAPVTTVATTSSLVPEPEDAMKGLFGQMLQSMSERTEKKITELLPQMVSRDLAGHVAKAVEAEVRAQMGASLSEERLTQVLEPLLTRELPKILKQEMPTLEPIIRHSIFEIASPLIKEQIEQLVREQLSSLEELVKKEIEQAATKQAADIVEGVVRTTAHEQVEQTVLKLVPSIAEEQVKTEIQRLTAAA